MKVLYIFRNDFLRNILRLRQIITRTIFIASHGSHVSNREIEALTWVTNPYSIRQVNNIVQSMKILNPEEQTL